MECDNSPQSSPPLTSCLDSPDMTDEFNPFLRFGISRILRMIGYYYQPFTVYLSLNMSSYFESSQKISSLKRSVLDFWYQCPICVPTSVQRLSGSASDMTMMVIFVSSCHQVGPYSF